MAVQYFNYVGGLPTLQGPPSFGIGVADPNTHPNHQASVMSALTAIDLIPVGRQLLQAICGRIAAANGACRVGIQPWDLQQTNNCAATNGDNAKPSLVHAVEFDRTNVHMHLPAAMTAVGQAGQWAWLATQICNHPIINIVGAPNVAASSTVHGANWVTTAMTTAWGTTHNTFPGPLAGQAAIDAQLILIAVLRNGLAGNAGTHATVRWSSASTQFTDTNGVAQVRPPYIGLAHELVHAYHDIMGDQTGHDIGTPTRALYEYLCIGLGDWAGVALSENAIRASGGMALRACY